MLVKTQKGIRRKVLRFLTTDWGALQLGTMSEAQPTIYDYVVVGGGVGAAYFVSSLAPNLLPSTCLVISSDPGRLRPYERPAVTKGCLEPDKGFLREPSGGNFPYCTKGEGGEGMDAEWYENKEGVTYLAQTKAEGVSFSDKVVSLSDGSTVGYNTHLIATGVRARVLDSCSLSGSTWDECHSGDIDDQFQLVDERKYGFGSTHVVRDVGDAIKLVSAMRRVEDDDQKTCYDPIVVVGGGFIAMETAAAISMHSPDNHVTVVMNGDHFLEGVFTREMSEFYERHLSQKFGVR